MAKKTLFGWELAPVEEHFYFCDVENGSQLSALARFTDKFHKGDLPLPDFYTSQKVCTCCGKSLKYCKTLWVWIPFVHEEARKIDDPRFNGLYCSGECTGAKERCDVDWGRQEDLTDELDLIEVDLSTLPWPTPGQVEDLELHEAGVFDERRPCDLW